MVGRHLTLTNLPVRNTRRLFLSMGRDLTREAVLRVRAAADRAYVVGVRAGRPRQQAGSQLDRTQLDLQD